jgi:RHS repeat-associated protein
MKILLSKLLAPLAVALALPAVAAPTVSLTAPTNGNLYLAPATFAVKANASASGVGINRVEFYANGVLINTDTTSPYQFDWTGVGAGTYSITAKAVDNNGAETTSAACSATVSGTNSPPTISLSAPADGARFLNPSNIGLSATASGPELNDLLQRVDFYVDGALAGTATSAPYTFSWSSPSVGTHSVTAVAVDGQGASTTSATRTIIVSNQNQPPTVSIVTPTDNSLWHSPASSMFQASTSSGESNDTVMVEFYVNGVLQGSDSTAPYSINLTSLAAGTYALMARAVDGQGAQTDSVTRTITVSDANVAPTVTISAPTNNANYPSATAGFTINASASAGEVNGWVTKVEFYVNGNLVNTDTAGPWSYAVSGLANGTYSVVAKAFDQLDASATSTPITVTVGPQPKMYFLQVDHLNTPRLVANQNGQAVWGWAQQEPFGLDVPDENPSGLGAFEFPLRFPGQYFDKESNLTYNWMRDYDASTGRYVESDPIGIRGGVNTYGYVRSAPTSFVDSRGLQSTNLLGSGRSSRPWAFPDATSRAQQDLARRAQRWWNSLSESDESNGSGSTTEPRNAAQDLPDQTDRPRSETEVDLARGGFAPAEPSGSYDEYVHPDGSRVFIGPDGRIIRIGPRIPGKKYGKRYRPGGVEIPHEPGADTHDTGERCIPGK